MITYTTLYGQDIAKNADKIGELRMNIFREFPYLYEGSLEFESAYMANYYSFPSAMVTIAESDGEIVGAITCIALEDANEYWQEPFKSLNYSPSEYCYFGENLIYQEFRGVGVGKKLMEYGFEHARSINKSKICLCAIEREKDHPLRPANYHPIDVFCNSLGFSRHPELNAILSWQQIDTAPGIETENSMIFWIADTDRSI